MPSDAPLVLTLPKLAGGGAERVFCNLANEFAGRGIRTQLVLLKKEGPYLDFVSPAVELVDLNTRYRSAIGSLSRHFRAVNPRAVMSSLRLMNGICALAHRFSGVRSPLVLREANVVTSIQKNRGVMHEVFERGLMYATYPLADTLAGNSDDTLQSLRDRHIVGRSAKLKVIPNPVAGPWIDELALEFVDHPWLTNEYFTVIACGRLVPQKGFPALIEAIAQVRETVPEVRLIILGDGDQRSELEALVAARQLSQNVDLPGFVKNPFAFFKRASLFVLSSRWEGFGNVLVEAMQCGLPVVSTDCPGGPRFILDGGKYGTLTPVDDPSALARAIIASRQNRLPPALLRQRAMDFSISTIADQYLEILG